MLILNRIDVQRGLRASFIAAAIGLGVAALAAVATPFWPVVGPMAYTLFVCAAWLAYAPDGKHRLVADLAVLFLLSCIVKDGASSAFPREPYYATLITVAAQIVITLALTAVRAVRVRRKNQPRHAEPGVGADSR
jgi:4-hydroxybenzoate polyprenyltransferase